MDFVLRKLIIMLLQPSHLALAAVVLGLCLITWRKREMLGKRLAWLGVVYMLIAGFSPLGYWLLFPLEQHYSSVPKPVASDEVAGIIMLGGFEDGWVTGGRRMLSLNDASERLTEGVRLSRQLPEAQVVYTGGVGTPWPWGEGAAESIGSYLIEADISPSRIVLERQSRTTEENASMTADLVRPTADQKWVLVTSAFHMPRAAGLFRRAGFNVIPYPVDFRTRDQGDKLKFSDRFADGHKRTDMAFNEWLGLLYYGLSGKIDAMFPTP